MKETVESSSTLSTSSSTSTKAGAAKPLEAQVKANIREVLDAQEDRVRLLHAFDTQFKTYLLDAPEFDFNALKTLCKSTSDRMNEISTRILAIRNQFAPDCFDLTRLYSLVDRLQDGEQRKFKLVLASFFFLVLFYLD